MSDWRPIFKCATMRNNAQQKCVAHCKVYEVYLSLSIFGVK